MTREVHEHFKLFREHGQYLEQGIAFKHKWQLLATYNPVGGSSIQLGECATEASGFFISSHLRANVNQAKAVYQNPQR